MGAMLLLLHVALLWGFEDWWARALLLAHYGVFLVWQPLFGGSTPLGGPSAAGVLAGGALLTALPAWWLLGLWLALLAALGGAHVSALPRRRDRLPYLVALFYLLSALLVWVVPRVFGHPPGQGLARWLMLGLTVLPFAVLAARPAGRAVAPAPASALDFVYGLLLLLLIGVLVLGSFALMVIARDSYALALTKTLLAIGALLLLLAWMWNPRAGFAGLGQVLSRYLLSLGLPFERWLGHLTELAEREAEPEAFLAGALRGLMDLPWLAGGRWRAGSAQGEFGAATAYAVPFGVEGLELTLYARAPLSPAMQLHVHLLVQLLGTFYQAKRRELTLRQNAYAQAIFETGARLTHDVKNLLQSLDNLCAAAQQSDASQAAELQALMRRQLPQISQRLGSTLEKLRAPTPEAAAVSPPLPCVLWWENLRARYARDGLHFGDDPGADGANPAAGGVGPDAVSGQQPLPVELFDSVADNLIANARQKRLSNPDLRIEVNLRCAAGAMGVEFTVCDDGEAVPDKTAAHLFAGPVDSASGLGIGLYQAYKQAAAFGFRLGLAENRDGRVCFRLTGPQPAEAEGEPGVKIHAWEKI